MDPTHGNAEGGLAAVARTRALPGRSDPVLPYCAAPLLTPKRPLERSCGVTGRLGSEMRMVKGVIDQATHKQGGHEKRHPHLAASARAPAGLRRPSLTICKQ